MTDDRDHDQAPHDEPDRLLEELRRIASIVDPVPERAIEAGQAAFAWRTFDAEFAALVHDSLAVAAPAGVRSDEAPPLLLTFESEHLLVEVKVIRVGAEGGGGAAHGPKEGGGQPAGSVRRGRDPRGARGAALPPATAGARGCHRL